jgi:hypothetical protein
MGISGGVPLQFNTEETKGTEGIRVARPYSETVAPRFARCGSREIRDHKHSGLLIGLVIPDLTRSMTRPEGPRATVCSMTGIVSVTSVCSMLNRCGCR